MKGIIFFLTLFLMIIASSCTSSSTDNGSHGKEKPEFILDSLGTSGYASDANPLEIVFIIDENSIKGDVPYKFIWDFGDGTKSETSTKLEKTHLYKKQGIYTAKVIMQDNDYVSDEKTPDETYSQELTIVAKSKVDLVVQVAQIDKIVYDKGDEGNVTIKIANLGNEATTETVKLKAFLSEDQKLDKTDYELGVVDLESLAEAESIEKEIPFTISNDLTPKNYWVIIKVDYDNLYIESNEGNNTNVINSQVEILGATGKSPDLAFDSVDLPEFFIVNDQFKINANIINQGETASLPFSYKLVLSKNETLDATGAEDNDDIILKYDFVSDSIISGDTLAISVQTSIPEEGNYYLFLILDPTDDVKESDENNNIYKSEKITVGKTLTGVDLVPFNIIINPLTNITKGKTLSVSYSIKNRGNHPALKTNARVLLSTDESLDDSDILLPFEGGDLGEIDPIAGAVTIEKTHRVAVPDTEDFQEGDYYILVDINYIKENETERPIEEADYSNNLLSSEKITIGGSSGGCTKDILVDNLEILPTPAFESSPFTVKFNMSNVGSENVASFVTKIYTGNPNVDLDDDNYLKKNYNVSRLSANGTLTKEIILDIPNHLPEDRYCVLIKADATNTIGECDEQNNILNYCFDVTTRGDNNDITLSDIDVSEESIDLNENNKINVNFKVSNLGTTNTATFYCKAYLSPDNEFSPNNDFSVLESYTIYNILGGTEQNITDYEITIPKNMGDRDYKLFINCDDTKIVPETDETNNFLVYENNINVKGSDSGCNADIYEINDISDLAKEIDLTSDITSGLCDQDIDWYKFTLNKTHKFRIDLEQGFSDKDIDLVLYKMNEDDELVEVMVSDSTEIRETIEKNILTDEDEGLYYLKVFPKDYSTMSKTDYTLQVSYEEVGGVGIDLSLKDVNTDTINNIMTDEEFTLNFSVENLKNNDSGNFVIGVYLSSDNEISNDDVMLGLLNANSLGLLEKQDFEATMTLTESLTSGTYNLIIKVDPYGLITETNEDNNAYTKELMVNYNSSCELDLLEPNSWDPLLGKVVSNGNYSNLKLCSDDKDVYLIYLKKNSEFTVNVYFTDDEGDIEIKLYKPNDTSYSGSVASSTSSSDNEDITYTAEETGFYILKVYKFSSGESVQTYSMELSGIVDGFNFINKKLEILSSNLATDENTFLKYRIDSESTKNLTTAMNFKIYLSTDPILDDSTDIMIYNELINSFNLGTNIEKRVKVRLPSGLSTGNYYFISKVDADDSIVELNENDNTKVKVATIVGECQEDRFESNNSMAEADRNDSILSVGTYDNLTICPTDRDYYKIYLTSGLDLFINLYFTDPIGDLDLVLYNTEGVLIADSSSETNDEHIHFNVLNSGWYFIRVDGVEYDTNAYNLEILTPSCDNVNCNSGVCDFTETGEMICVCDDGYTGDTCDVCADGYHDNNGVCEIDETCQQDSCQEAFKNSCSVVGGVVECSCNSGYTEDNNGNCIIDCDITANLEPNDANDACVCIDGYHDDNGVCEIDETCEVDSCTDTNKSVCNVVAGVVECSCDDGYTGDTCSDCASGYHDNAGVCDIDETCTPNPCTATNKSVCNVVAGVVECSCDEGYTGDTCSDCASGYHQDTNDISLCIAD